jgi:4-amino-4-deoxy-L-arabinose transferase-like glycosyltransferase
MLLLVALGLRIAEVERTSYRPINDGVNYLQLGAQIAHLGDYSSADSGAAGSRGPSAYFPPAYPYFIAVVDLLDGHRTPRGAAIRGVRVAQALLGTATVALVGLVGLELFGAVVGLIALAVAAAYPGMIELVGTVVAENLLTAFVLAAVWTALRARRPAAAWKRYGWVVATGALTGLATLSHVNGVVLVPALVIAMWGGPPRLAWRALAAPGLLIAATVLVIAPWTVRNAVALHHFIPVSDETGITLAGTYNPTSAANHRVPYRWQLYRSIPSDRDLVPETPHLSEPALDARLRERALDYITDHPLVPLAVASHNTLRLLELEGSFAWRASAAAIGLSAGTARIGVVAFWLLCALALGGAFTRLARSVPRWVWLVPILFALSAVLVNAETPRFREPVDPFLVLLAACAISVLVRSLRPSVSRHMA